MFTIILPAVDIYFFFCNISDPKETLSQFSNVMCVKSSLYCTQAFYTKQGVLKFFHNKEAD